MTLFVRHTHKEVPKADIDSLLSIYGELLCESRFCKKGEFETDIYTVNIRLKFLIPEFLPIRGKRARIYYHGIAPFCIVCNTPSHLKPECHNAPVHWSDYIQSLKNKGIPARLFDPIPENIYGAGPSSQSNKFSNPFTSTPRHPSSAEDLLRSLFEGAFAPKANTDPTPSTSKGRTEIDPTFSASTPRSLNVNINPTFKATGRGRGSKGRGNPFHSQAPDSDLNFGAGRGRGRGKAPEQNLNRGRGTYNFRNSK